MPSIIEFPWRIIIGEIGGSKGFIGYNLLRNLSF
jgi:hypothetical protein